MRAERKEYGSKASKVTAKAKEAAKEGEESAGQEKRQPR